MASKVDRSRNRCRRAILSTFLQAELVSQMRTVQTTFRLKRTCGNYEGSAEVWGIVLGSQMLS